MGRPSEDEILVECSSRSDKDDTTCSRKLQGSFNRFCLPWFHHSKRVEVVFWSANWTHKSADCFPEPEKFDSSRFEGKGPAPYTFVPFGGGPRMCPGNQYARVVIFVFMHQLVTRFKWEKFIPDEKPLLLPSAKGLPIRLIHHQKM